SREPGSKGQKPRAKNQRQRAKREEPHGPALREQLRRFWQWLNPAATEACLLHLLTGGISGGRDALDFELEVVRIAGILERRFVCDQSLLIKVVERLIKRLHAVLRCSYGDGFADEPGFSGVLMSSRTKAVEIRNSKAGTRAAPSARLTRRWLMTARRVAASCMRICFCSGGGNTAMIRLMVSTASRVWSVEKTRWPVSAAWSAVEMVSRSRISPTRI